MFLLLINPPSPPFCKGGNCSWRDSTARFEYRLADHLLELQDELQTRRYRPGPYRHFFIHEGKRRKISAAPFRDRVVHHALCNVIEPAFERRFIVDSYANQVGKRARIGQWPGCG